MEELNKREELEWILLKLQEGEGMEEVFLIEHVIRKKPYSRKDVESWGKEEEYKSLWNKIDDILHVRLLEAAQAGKIDKVIAGKRLSAKYEYSDRIDAKLTGSLIVNILPEGSKL